MPTLGSSGTSSAGSGDASRSVSLNGTIVPTIQFPFPTAPGLAFPAPPSWGDWHECSIVLYLQAGQNTVSIAFDAAAGSGALDLDAIKIAPSPGR